MRRDHRKVPDTNYDLSQRIQFTASAGTYEIKITIDKKQVHTFSIRIMSNSMSRGKTRCKKPNNT